MERGLKVVQFLQYAILKINSEMLKEFYENTKPEDKSFFIKIVNCNNNHQPLGLSKFSIGLANIYLFKVNN